MTGSLISLGAIEKVTVYKGKNRKVKRKVKEKQALIERNSDRKISKAQKNIRN